MEISRPVRFSISNARNFLQHNQPAEAIANYLAVLKTMPVDTRKRYVTEMMTTLSIYLKSESESYRALEVLNNVSGLYEFEFSMWKIYAEWMFNRGDLTHSLEMFTRALAVARSDADWLHAMTSIENIKSNFIDAWHWLMINDEKRNRAFFSALEMAIKEVIKRKDQVTVIDIGCGSGILSIFAEELKANRVFACDSDQTMCAIAQECFQVNCCRNISLIPTHSTVADVDTPCDILVTETLDCAMFGEQIITTVLDAKERLLDTDFSIVIPNQVVGIFALMESGSVAEESFCELNSYDTSNQRWKEYVVASPFCYIRKKCDSPYFTEYYPPEPYTCAFLNDLANHSDDVDAETPRMFRLLSEPVEGLTLNFNNKTQLNLFKSNSFSTEIVLTAATDGVAHAVVSWFRLNLYGDISICTSPTSDHCWQQAIFPFYPPKALKAGEKLRCAVSVYDNKLMVCPKVDTEPEVVDLISRVILRSTSDVNMPAMHNTTIKRFFMQSIDASAFKRIIDCTDLLLFNEKLPVEKRKKAMEKNTEDSTIHSGAKDDENDKTSVNEDCFRYSAMVASDNALIRYASEKPVRKMSDVLEAVRNDSMKMSAFSNDASYDEFSSSFGSDSESVPIDNCCILFWPLNSRGMLVNDCILSIVELNIQTAGRINVIPMVIRLHAVLISSEFLSKQTRASSNWNHHCGINLSPINTYKLQYVHDLDLVNDLVDFQCLSEPFEMFSIRFDKNEEESLSELLKFRNVKDVCINVSGRLTGLLYWFEFSDGMGNELRMSDYPKLKKASVSGCSIGDLSAGDYERALSQISMRDGAQSSGSWGETSSAPVVDSSCSPSNTSQEEDKDGVKASEDGGQQTAATSTFLSGNSGDNILPPSLKEETKDGDGKAVKTSGADGGDKEQQSTKKTPPVDEMWSKVSACVLDDDAQQVSAGTYIVVEASLYHGNVLFRVMV